MRAIPIVAILLGLWLAVGAATAQTTPPLPDAERIAAAKELMEASGSADQFDQVMPMMMSRLSQSFEAMRPEKADEIRKVMTEGMKRFTARKHELLEQIAGIYARTMSLEDLKAITAFYQSPAGTRFRQAMPSIAQQSMLAGQKWGSQIGAQIEQEMRAELKKRGIEL
jgi:hypothetical protein